MSENKEPLVTAVITTYKRKPEIVKRALHSIVGQTYSNIEIFVVNDCPSDKKLVEDLQNMIVMSSGDRTVHYIVVEKNGGACRARNLALEKAQGKYFACLDDDDEWLPKKIELQVKALEEHQDAAIAYCNAVIKYADIGKETVRFNKKQNEGNLYYELIGKNNIGSCSFPMFRVDAIKKVSGFDVNMPALQDWDLYLRILKENKAVYVHEPVAVYYFYEGERISAHPENRITAYERLHQKIGADLEKNRKSASSFYLMGTYFYSLAGDVKTAMHYYVLGVKNDPCNFKRNVKDFFRMMGRKFVKPSKV